MPKPKNEQPILQMDIVERPLATKMTWPISEEAKAILDTVETGKAVRLKFRSSEEAKKIQMALRHIVTKKGLAMRYRRDASDRIVCWAEKLAGKGDTE